MLKRYLFRGKIHVQKHLNINIIHTRSHSLQESTYISTLHLQNFGILFKSKPSLVYDTAYKAKI